MSETDKTKVEKKTSLWYSLHRIRQDVWDVIAIEKKSEQIDSKLLDILTDHVVEITGLLNYLEEQLDSEVLWTSTRDVL